MKIVLYTICWNEEVLMPFFIKHYLSFCDKIIIYDNGSTDKSVEIAKSWYPYVELRTYDTNETVNDSIRLDINNNCWKEVRQTADYVIVCDFDELLYHKQGTKEFLEQKLKEGITIFKPQGYNVLDNHLPNVNIDIFKQYPFAFKFDPMSKYIIFNPKEVREINYGAGCHSWCAEQPEGNLNWYIAKAKDDLMLVHFKQIEYNYWKNKEINCLKRLSEDNIKHGWGTYKLDFENIHTEQWYNAEIEKLKNIY